MNDECNGNAIMACTDEMYHNLVRDSALASGYQRYLFIIDHI